MKKDQLVQPDAVEELYEHFSLGEPTERELWRGLYGFDHDCTCEEDYENDNTEMVAACYLNATDDAFRTLRAMRGYLYTIATTPIEDAATLRSLAAAALGLETIAVH